MQQGYFISGQKLTTKSDAKYLGVTICSDLSWSKHKANIYKKADSTMAFMRRSIRPAFKQAKSTAYKTFVRPILEYTSTVWTPHTEADKNQLKMVQSRAVRFVKVDYIRTSSVIDLNEDLSWNTLQQCRDQAQLSMMYRIVHHLVSS